MKTLFPVSTWMGTGAAGGSGTFFAVAIGMASNAIKAAMQKVSSLVVRGILLLSKLNETRYRSSGSVSSYYG
jgi:hypothetical protein